MSMAEKEKGRFGFLSTVKVTGTGMLRLTPDTTRIDITLHGPEKEYADAVRRSAEDTEALKDLLEKLGFARNELKTLNFRVDPRYESYQENNIYRQRLTGYEFYHSMKIEFPSDNAFLGRVLYALANSRLTPEFSLSYTVKDKEASKNKLIGAAVKDAKAKAKVLAKASGVELGHVLSINYSMTEPDFVVRPMAKMMMARNESADMAGGYNIDIEPESIQVSDTVTIVWTIRQKEE